MKFYRRIFSALAAMLLVFGLCPGAAEGEELPTVSAQCWALADGDSGRILASSGAEEPRLIASTTKLMTAYTAVNLGLDLDETVVVSAQAAGTEGSSMYLSPGEEISLRDLLWGMLLVSGNDAATALAEGCCGSVEAFVEKMNENARELGMEQASFENPTGLDGENHHASAADLVKLCRAVLADDTLAEIVSSRSATVAGRSLTNHNKLLGWYEGCIGLKTGYTQAAGRTLVSAARRDGVTLICVTLSDPDDWADHMALFDWGFDQYTQETLCQKGEILGCLSPYGLFGEELHGADTVTALVGAGDRVTSALTLSPPVETEQGTQVGTLTYYIAGAKVGETALLRETAPP
jgi:D-alanyl-D-alanine carboxypeptidase